MAMRMRLVYALMIVAVLAGTVWLRVADPVFLQALRSLAFDTYQRLQPSSYNDNTAVRIVAIDAESLDRIGPWPWPGEVMAALLADVADRGAAIVAFDVPFPHGDDEAFAATVAASPSVLPVVLTNLPTDDPVPPAKASFVFSGDDPLPYMPSFANVATNGPALDAAAAGLGAITRPTSGDGVFRRLPLVSRIGSTILPALALEVMRVAQGADSYTLTASADGGAWSFGRPPGITGIAVGDVAVPTDPDGGMRLDLRPANPAAHVPAWQVLEGTDDGATIAGRIVIVGLTAAAHADFRSTPLEASITRVELQAEAIEHILSGRTVTRPGHALAIEIGVVVVVGLLLAWLLPRLRLVAGVAASIVAIAGIAVAGWFAYRDLGLVFDPTWPVLSVWVLAALAALLLHRRLEARRAEIRAAFGGALSPAAIDAVMVRPDRLVLGGETRELTVLFCQIRNFAAITEQLEPRDLVAFVNRIYAATSDAILAHHGTIARNMGDSLLAFWNAPLDDEEHAANACRAAAAVLRDMRGIDAGLGDGAIPGEESAWEAVGIGVATGNCVVGNLGGGERFDYTAIGDDVGLAARLESLSRFYGVGMVVGEATVDAMTEPRILELDLVRVRGRRRPLRLFTTVEAIDADAATLDQLAPIHAAMIACFRNRDWDGAEAALHDCRAFGVRGLTTFYSLYRTRIATFREIAPSDDWDGADATTLQ